jgi:hypothetical protein
MTTHQWIDGGDPAGGTGNVAENNLIYNMEADVGGNIQTHDYNGYFVTTGEPVEAHGQVSAVNPFVNVAGDNYHLSIHTDAGLDLGASYNIDPDGMTRTAWDRGAYEFITSPWVMIYG